MRRTALVDLGVSYSRRQQLLKYLYARRRHGRWVSVYQWSPLRDWRMRRILRSSLERQPVDAVVEIGDLASLDTPFYLYQDLSFDVLARYYDPGGGIPGFEGIDLETIKRRQQRQRKIYDSAAGIFAMSEWFARTLVDWSGLPPAKVIVAYAGLNALGEEEFGAGPDVNEGKVAEGGPARLLFVGRDFYRKGGESVLGALSRLRREYSPDLRLTVAGPRKWPLPGNVPEAVTFLGDLPVEQVARLYREHDLFVMPSRFEAFGIVFREALANGIPAIGRKGFAMSEIIIPGKNGALVSGDDPDELASEIVSVLESPTIRQQTALSARGIREDFSWEAVAGRMLAAIPNPDRA